MPESFRKHFIYVACIFLFNYSVRGHVPHAYRNIEMTKEHISLILELNAMSYLSKTLWYFYMHSYKRINNRFGTLSILHLK